MSGKEIVGYIGYSASFGIATSLTAWFTGFVLDLRSRLSALPPLAERAVHTLINTFIPAATFRAIGITKGFGVADPSRQGLVVDVAIVPIASTLVSLLGKATIEKWVQPYFPHDTIALHRVIQGIYGGLGSLATYITLTLTRMAHFNLFA